MSGINEILLKEHDADSNVSVKKSGLYGWDYDNLVWRKLKIDANGTLPISGLPTADNTVEVLLGADTIEGKLYPTIADAIVYVNAQTPAADNFWCIKVLDYTNAENFTCPNFTTITGGSGFAGLLSTHLTGNISLGYFSTLNSVQPQGQITIASDNNGVPAIMFGCYVLGTIVSPAGTYFQPVLCILQLASDLELNGQMTSVDNSISANTINVNAGGVLAGYIDLSGGTVADNGGTIVANSYGPFYDNGTSGLSSDTVGDAIDELDTNIDTNTSNISTNTSDISTNTSDISTLDTNKADKSNVLELDNTDAFTPDADYEPATKKYTDDAGLWEVSGDETQLKVARDIDVTADKKLFYN